MYGARMPSPRSRDLLLPLLWLAACSGGPPESIAPPPPTATPIAAPPVTPPQPQPPLLTSGPPTSEPPTSAPPTISAALASVPAAVSENYQFSLSADRNELTVDPRPQASRRSRAVGGFSTKDSANGGKIITLAGGPFRGGSWVRASFRAQVPAEAQLAELRRSGYDVEQVRDLLVVDGEQDTSPTVFAFSADPRKPGIVGICSQVTIVDFGPGTSRPVAVRKPVIYLYPQQTTRVRVEVDIAGEFTAVYPRMTDGGWTVTASPTGELVDLATGRQHRYLFWEGTSAGFEIDPKRAHCVPGAGSAAFLERACDRFALSPAECGDFVTYWLPALTRHSYNVIEFVDEQVYERYAHMQVEPRPDTVVRQFMIFRGSATPVTVGAPPLPQRTRTGFTVVEWGGAELDDPARAVIH